VNSEGNSSASKPVPPLPDEPELRSSLPYSSPKRSQSFESALADSFAYGAVVNGDVVNGDVNENPV
jgi:hypothetical protein